MEQRERDLLKAVSLSGDVLQILLQSLTKLADLLLGNHHLLTDEQQGLQADREREGKTLINIHFPTKHVSFISPQNTFRSIYCTSNQLCQTLCGGDYLLDWTLTASYVDLHVSINIVNN